MSLRILPPPLPRPVLGPPQRLKDAAEGGNYQIIAMRMDPGTRKKLEDLGLLPSRIFQLLFQDPTGRAVLRLDGELILLGRRETPHIEVRSWKLSS